LFVLDAGLVLPVSGWRSLLTFDEINERSALQEFSGHRPSLYAVAVSVTFAAISNDRFWPVADLV
jgi:hypothetical protein